MNLILVGYGKMGQAMLDGWLKQALLTNCIIIDPYADNAPDNTTLYKDITALPENTSADVIVFAVKPQVMADVLPAYTKHLTENTVCLSIAAGKTLSALQEYLGTETKIIRAMPNTPAAIGQGITVACGSPTVSKTDQENALALLAAVGDALWLEDEAHMNAVTAVSGSGPAYIFLLIETMTKAGIQAGLSQNMAEKLARQTVIGSAALAAEAADTPAATLRENVTSPGGTTAAALDVLMHEDTGLQPLMTSAISAAKKRGQELA